MQEAPVAQSRNIYLIYLIVFIAALGGFLFGYGTGVISGAILFINKEFHLTTMQTSFIVSALLIGACISAVLSGRFADYFGRRKLLLIDAFLYLVGIVISCTANSVIGIFVGRLIVGLGVGISSFVVPLYISELAHFKKRGIMVGFNQLFIVTGILVAYLADYWLAGGGHWRWMLGLEILPALGLLAGMLFAPESPRWLVANGSEYKAVEVLQAARADINVELELAEMKESVYEQRDDWRMLFKPWLIPAVIVGFGLAALQQLVGINIFIYYTPLILQLSGFEKVTSIMLATLGLGILLEIFTIIVLPLIDAWGRRPLLLLGAGGMTLSFILVGASFIFLPQILWIKWVILFSTILYIASFGISFGPIGWLMIAEMFPLRIRGLASSLATATIWGFDLLVILTFLPLMQLLQPTGVFWLYGVLCLLSLIFVYLFVPETKGITLEHIETNLRLGKHSRYLGI